MANNGPISTSEPPVTTSSDKKSIKDFFKIDAFSLKMAGILYLILGIAFAASAQTVRRESFSFQDHVYHVSLWPVHTVMAAGAVWGGIYAIGDEKKKTSQR